MKIVIIQRAIPHYRVPFFRAVQDRAGEAGMDLTVYAAAPVDPETSRRFRCRTFPVSTLGTNQNGFCWMMGMTTALRGTDVVVAPQEMRCLTIPYLWLWRKDLCRRWIWWGHGYNYQRGMRPEGLQALTEGVRRFVSRRGDGLITYTEGGAVFWRSRGIPPGRVVSYNNTVDVEEIRRAASRIPEERLRESRRQFGLEGKNVLLFSGRLYPEKRVDLLLEAMAILRRTRPGVGLLILGDGPERKFLENSVSRLKLQDIHFIGECVRPEESGIYFRLADLLVIPGLVGLAVVHGFALGLPLVTTKHDYHSPEIEYLSDENGLMTSHDPSAYADGIRRLLASPERLTAMREAAGRQGDGLRLSASAERFVDGINSLCEQDP